LGSAVAKHYGHGFLILGMVKNGTVGEPSPIVTQLSTIVRTEELSQHGINNQTMTSTVAHRVFRQVQPRPIAFEAHIIRLRHFYGFYGKRRRNGVHQLYTKRYECLMLSAFDCAFIVDHYDI